MQDIIKSGIYNFYNSSDLFWSDDSDIKILEYLNQDNHKKILVGKNTIFKYNIFIQNPLKFDIDIYFNDIGNIGEINILCLGNSFEISGKINVYINGSENKIKLKITNLLGENGISKVTGNIFIPQGIKGSSGDIFEETVFLGEKGKTYLVPQLNIASNEIKASHGVKIEKLNKDKLFYIQSKGLSDLESKNLMINGYFQIFFNDFNINEDILQGYLTFLNQRCQI